MLAGCGAEPEPNAAESIVLHGNAEELIVPKPAPEANIANAVAAAAPAVNLAPDGLSVALTGGATRLVPFGMPREAATQMIAGVIGNPIEQGDNQECGAGALGFASFREGLGLYFQGGKFAGWDLDGREGGRFATAAGLGIGSARTQLESASKVEIEDSTIGIEFRAGGLSGLLSARDPSGEVTNLWAGVTCIAR
ncbi:hypothetical protein [Sphingomonas sp. LM7]|uniref:hypothetical protein n=1 Tax=Sphingomonas sp. LM7 TaxID=1938607 RepID=UPI000983F9CF|nr:hypothetical protein [Sphingomonas sp. LM7]AQR75421.1 hypothetical protein BXU08_18765 [Sphingomonas sp. LM7]